MKDEAILESSDLDLDQEITDDIVCKNCQSPNVEDGYTIPLCKACREKYYKKSLPAWVIGLLCICAALAIFSLIQFPKSLGAGIAYEKGTRFAEAHKYISAAREFEKVKVAYPDSTIALCELFIAQFYNSDIYNAENTLGIISGRELKNEEVLNEVNTAVASLDTCYYLSKETEAIVKKNDAKTLSEIATIILDYGKTHKLNGYEKYLLGNHYFEENKFTECNNLLSQVIKEYPQYSDAYLLLAAAARETGNYDKGIAYCQKALEINRENVYAIGALSRLQIKKHLDKEGLETALSAYQLNRQDPYVLSTLAIAYHFNNMMNERDKIVAEYKKAGGLDEYTTKLMTDIFSGKLKWRN